MKMTIFTNQAITVLEKEGKVEGKQYTFKDWEWIIDNFFLYRKESTSWKTVRNHINFEEVVIEEEWTMEEIAESLNQEGEIKASEEVHFKVKDGKLFGEYKVLKWIGRK